ncbi:ABC transporter permease [Spongiactinospora sp. TRM90649]|uniref:ABC transporter permease n=1 Tax=Spongiactinospora sp. TRM90649 TaxID=3031114 RepID=UPI0023F76F95|nr:ABC transporter permease [Spongiactinospora sp. TRM90649]MDF5754374.1 ABC transporter permease [Spongiactinospora sp. TRM90649]
MRSSSFISLTPALPVVLVLLVALGALVAWLGRLGHERAVLTASLRAVVQLGAVAALITVVVAYFAAATAFILLMFGVAAFTAGRRITPGRTAWRAAAPVAAGTVPVLALLAVTRTISMDAIVVIPVAGILLGGCMTATSLAGRRAMDELVQRRGEVEAALSLGFSPSDAALEICRPAANQALVPALDQTRTVGLVTLPGAFVGMLLGGASPIEAGAVQLVVLVALLAAEAVAVLVTTHMVARGHFT